jgi:hypothetical protein
MFPCLFATAYGAACACCFWECCVVPVSIFNFLLLWGSWGFLLQLYTGHEPDVVRIGLFRKHRPPEELSVGDNYATFYFGFLHEPLLFNALLALSLNRWLDFENGPQD